MSSEPITASAPAKVILFGEHAVVYGQPALAVPVSALRVTVTVTAAQSTTFAAGEWTRAFPAQVPLESLTNPVLRMAQLTAAHLGIPVPPGRFEIASTIPIASGLGSGAAVSAAVGRAVALAAGRTISNDELNSLVFEIEVVHHGTPSGIDNTVIVFEEPVYFVRGQPAETFASGEPMHLLIADTGRAALTKESVGDVRRLVEAGDDQAIMAIEIIGEIATSARGAVAAGNLAYAGALMNKNHELLRDSLRVSSEELDTLVEAAVNAGAYGAKLSGGGRGGNMIALISAEKRTAVRAALVSAGAARVIETTVS
jgi:mevalonate kinase